jgi:DNA topoisomerase I
VKTAFEDVERIELPQEESTVICEKCGRTMVYKYGRFGKFLACPGYPECKNTKPIRKEMGVSCPKCGTGQIMERKSKKGRFFYGCNQYPACDFVSWERPYKTPCPKCGSMCVLKGSKDNKMIVCLKEGCGYTAKFEEQGEDD